MSSNPYLLLWFEAPLQSWGFDSKFGRRDTLNFPTFSGVLGLICCAMGRSGGQDEFLADFSDMDMSVIAYTKSTLNKNLFLRDFHMVGSGYDVRDEWQSLLIPKKSDGKRSSGTSGSKLTYRYYLQNMAFAVALEVPSTYADEVADAVKSPVWDLYLGRKCCVPTELIFQGQFHNDAEAFAKAEELAVVKKLTKDFRVLKGEHEGEVRTLNDIPIRFGQNKIYRDRRVTIIDTEME